MRGDPYSEIVSAELLADVGNVVTVVAVAHDMPVILVALGDTALNVYDVATFTGAVNVMFVDVAVVEVAEILDGANGGPPKKNAMIPDPPIPPAANAPDPRAPPPPPPVFAVPVVELPEPPPPFPPAASPAEYVPERPPPPPPP